jgi:hypothetical protein
VSCIDPSRLRPRATRALAALVLVLLGACSSPRSPAPPPARAPAAPSVSPGPAVPGSAARARNWDEYKVQAGQRLVAANPEGTYLGTVPQPLLAIPVLEIELNRDGSVRSVKVQREPSQARDTVQLAIDAVKRVGPFGDVSHLAQPWKFSEVFLFRDDRRFKPRSLDP